MWQRDALRRLAQAEELNDEALKELMSLCKAEVETTVKANGLTATPVTKDHLPIKSQNKSNISILAIRHHSGVNALAEDQEIRFSSQGLNVVYGNNGSGKSGYARILRSLCRASIAETKVLGNAFRPKSEPARVDITVDVDNESKLFTWSNNARHSVEPLQRIAFFDGECGDVYLGGATELTYRPSGVGLLEKLASLCTRLTAMANQEHTLLRAQRPDLNFLPQESTLRRRVANWQLGSGLGKLKKEVDLSAEEHDKLARLQQQLAQVKAKLQGGALSIAKSRLIAVEILENMARKLQETCTEGGYARLQLVASDCRKKREAAALASKLAFSNEPVSGVGSEIWQELWEKAREFSNQAVYQENRFPNVEDGARCVLCCQSLSQEARERLSRFEEFVRHSTAREAEKATQKVEKIKNWLLESLDKFESNLESSGLSELNPELESLLQEDLAWLKDFSEHLLAGLDSFDLEPVELRALSLNAIQAEKERLGASVKSLEKLSTDEDIKRSQREYDELRQRALAAENWDKVEDFHQNREQEAVLKRVIAQFNTQSITVLASKIAEDLVSDEISHTFDKFMHKLCGRHLPVACKPSGGRKGVLFQSVVLQCSQSGVKTSDVVSEGERKCAALSTFLTEAKFYNETSALIFDDPVCSFDHQVRERIANLLAQEAKHRQVIIFTHDVVFLLALHEQVEKEAVDLKCHTLQRRGTSPGFICDGLPSIAQPIKKRVGAIKNDLQNLRSRRPQMMDEDYAAAASRLSALLRAGWECAVEEVALNGAVVRFGRAVQTKRLEKVAKNFDSEAYEELEQEITKLSCWIEGHDSASALNPVSPEPDELQEAVEALEKWVKRLR